MLKLFFECVSSRPLILVAIIITKEFSKLISGMLLKESFFLESFLTKHKIGPKENGRLTANFEEFPKIQAPQTHKCK